MIQVFTLRDPRDGGVRYVGVSQDVGEYVKTLCLKAGFARGTSWLVEVLDDGLQPEVVLEGGGWSTYDAALAFRSEVVTRLCRQGVVLDAVRRTWKEEMVPNTFDRVDPVLEQYELIMPVSRRRSWTQSRLCKLPDGTTMPVLRVLAREVFGTWNEKTHMPYWRDKDWTHELRENVGLVEIAAETPVRPTSAYGVPAGTKEYVKKWRAANPDRVKEAQRRYHRKRAALFAQLKAEVEAVPEPAAPETTSSLLDKVEALVDGQDGQNGGLPR